MTGDDFESNASEAERLKIEGQELVAANAADVFRVGVRQIICAIARSGREFTGVEVRDRAKVIGLAPPQHPNAWGAAMGGAARDGIIRATGAYVKSPVVSRHSAVVAVWVGDRVDAQPVSVAHPLPKPPYVAAQLLRAALGES